MNRGDFAFGCALTALGVLVCLTFMFFDSPILLAAWLVGLPMIFGGLISVADGIWGRRGAPESRASPVAREQAIPPETKREVWDRDGGACVLCGAITDLRFDHVIPDGGNDPANLRLLCGACHRGLAAPDRVQTATTP